jgi:hypothetical protein
MEVPDDLIAQVGWHIPRLYIGASLKAQSFTQQPREHIVINEHELAFGAQVEIVLVD